LPRIALLIEISLGRDVGEVEWIGIRLIRERRAVADDDDQSSGPQRLHDLAVACVCATPSREGGHGEQAADCHKPRNDPSRQNGHCATPLG